MTDPAVRFAKSVVDATGCAPILRVRVVGGGCRGLTWHTSLGDASQRDGDRRRRNGDLEVVVDGISARILEGAHVDVAEPGASGLREPILGRPEPLEFILRDLPSKDVCRCGESFSP